MRNTTSFEEMVEIIVYFNDTLLDWASLFVPKSLNNDEIIQTIHECYGNYYKFTIQN